ncbi:MAG: (d)CMP kinase [Rhizobiales bacterium]|nr:(d)CMP kinase [Hyphomicrobiales bacterium]
MIIAVDGPSAAGKGTLARGLAKALGYHFLDTGSLYRAVGLMMLRHDKALDDAGAAAQFAAALDLPSIRDGELRNEDVAHAASRISVYPKVRANLLQFQRDFARKAPGAVLDGRDIGTVVCPDADLKFFVTAATDVRARRRFDELKGQGQDVAYEAVFEDVMARDERDATRTTAPTAMADDAIMIDTSELTADEVLKAVLDVVREHAKG